MCLNQECSTWLNIAAAQEESGCAFEDVDGSYSKASHCAQRSGQARLQVSWTEQLKVEKKQPIKLKNSTLNTLQRFKLSGNDSWLCLHQKRALRLWLASQRRCGSSMVDDTEARLQEVCAAEGWSADGSDGEEDEEEEMDNSEPLDDSDVVLSDSGRLCIVDLLAFCPPDISRPIFHS